MQVGSATFIIRVIKHSGNSASCKSFPGCQDISHDISFLLLLPLSPCSYCSIFYQLLVFSRMSRHLMWHQLSLVSMLLLQHLLSATSSLHQSSSAAAVSPSKSYTYNSPSKSWIMHTSYPTSLNHKSCIILLLHTQNHAYNTITPPF